MLWSSRRANASRETDPDETSGRERQAQVRAQVERAAQLARRHATRRWLNEDGIFWTTDWIEIGPGPKAGSVVQAQLQRVDSVDKWMLRSDSLSIGLPVRRALSYVELYVRTAARGSRAAGHYDHPVIFAGQGREGEAAVLTPPAEGYDQRSSFAVQPGSPEWLNINNVLAKFEER
jgi:hypothetical protein